jgi:release factor glutamine methyltransferase
VLSATIEQAVRDGAACLAGVADNPRLEARILLAHALGITRNDLIREPNRYIDSTGYQALVERRMLREPVAHIVGRREFWSMEFRVSPATLIPRPDSETLIEAAVGAFRDRHPERILDLGTGTGCLLLALLGEFPCAFGIGIDLSVEAAALARSNADALGLAGRSAFMTGNWADALTGWREAGGFDLVISNPPYIGRSDIQGLMPEVACHEPVLALDGGVDGYDAYRVILPRLHQLLAPGGTSILELGHGQATYVARLAFEADFYSSLRVDLAEIPRAIVLSRLNP